MIPTHHPSDALLIGYAAGTTGESEALALSLHLTFCAACRDRVRAAEAMGGYLLEQSEAAPLLDRALQEVLARLDDDTEDTETLLPAVAPATLPALPAPIAGYAAEALRTTGWRWVAPGIQQLALATRGTARARLIRFKPGTVLPDHSHSGQELTVVLSGSYSDTQGRFACGDMAELDGSVDHRPQVDSDEDCVALIVTDSPLRFRGLIARLAQIWTGI